MSFSVASQDVFEIQRDVIGFVSRGLDDVDDAEVKSWTTIHNISRWS
jgi:hypothetical protein